MTISIISCRLIIAAKMIFHSLLSKSAHSCIIKQGGVNIQATMQVVSDLKLKFLIYLAMDVCDF